jgi:hypothetical protein
LSARSASITTLPNTSIISAVAPRRSSHAIHHFFVAQPFYLRELVRRDAHAAMRSHGVRFDDLGTFSRANRWGPVNSIPEAVARGA